MGPLGSAPVEVRPVPLTVPGPFERSWWAFREWLAHTLLIIGIMGCVALIEFFTKVLMHSSEPVFFDIMPVKWIFDGADLFVLVGLSIHGVKSALHAYRGKATT